ncbi:hypothetical protein DCC79_08330, partial [bacterium]
MRQPPRPEPAHDPADPLAARFGSGGRTAPRPAFRAALRDDLLARPPASPFWGRIAALSLPGPLARPVVALWTVVAVTAVTVFAAVTALRVEHAPAPAVP